MALRNPASKIVCARLGPTDQTRLGHSSHFAIERLWNPAEALNVTVGKKAVLRDADLRIRLGDRAFRGGDIGAPLQKLGRNADRDRRGTCL